MKHEEYQHSIPDYLSGRLPAADRARLESHLAECEECDDLVAALQSLPDAVGRHGDALFESHPEPSELRRHGLGELVAGREKIAGHLRLCASCGLEVAGWLASELPGETEDQRRFKGSGPARFAAAALLAVAGLVAGFLLAALAPWRAASVDGPIDLPVLAKQTRSGGMATRIQVRSDQFAVVIAIPFDPLAGRPGTESVNIQIVAADGRVVYTLHGTVAEMAQRADVSGVIALQLDKRKLPPGSYRLLLTGSGGTDDLLATLPFEVVTSGP